MTRLLVFGDDIIELIDNVLLQAVQCKEDSRLFNSLRYTVCMQVLEELQVALFLFSILPNRATISSLYWKLIRRIYSMSIVTIM